MQLSRDRLMLAGVAGIILAVGAGLFLVDPGRCGLIAPCPFHRLTGLYCPGCGTLRGLHQLSHGNILGALRFNPLMVLSLPFLAIAFVRYALRALNPARPAGRWARPGWIWALLGVILAFWVLRNLPGRPFSLLAPTG